MPRYDLRIFRLPPMPSSTKAYTNTNTHAAKHKICIQNTPLCPSVRTRRVFEPRNPIIILLATL